MPAAPAASRAKIESTRDSHHRYTGSKAGIPCAMVLTAYFGLSPVTGLFCHRRPAEHSTELDASVGASGPHDFAVRISIVRPAHMRVPDAAASTASRAQRS
jgi:hypothetical protein